MVHTGKPFLKKKFSVYNALHGDPGVAELRASLSGRGSNPFEFVLKNASEFDLNSLICFGFFFLQLIMSESYVNCNFLVGDVRVYVFATVCKNEPHLLMLQ